MLAPVMFALVVTAASAANDPPCTPVKAADNFDMDALSRSIWYENARYPTTWEENGECTMVKFYREGSQYKFYISEVLENSHKLTNYSGNIDILDNDKSGVIKFNSVWFEATSGSRNTTTTIVDVDYDHYCIFFECRYDPTAKVQTDHVWITSRAPILEPKARQRVQEFFAKNKYLDINKLIWDKFGNKDCTPVN